MNRLTLVTFAFVSAVSHARARITPFPIPIVSPNQIRARLIFGLKNLFIYFSFVYWSPYEDTDRVFLFSRTKQNKILKLAM